MTQNRFTSKIQTFITAIAFSACLCQSALAQTAQPAANQGNQQMSQQKSDKKADSAWLQKQLEEIEQKRKQVETYSPMIKGYFVSYSPTDYILIAVSPRARTEWLERENAQDVRQMPNNKLDSALDALAAAVAEKLPIYRMNLELYTIRHAAGEKLMKAALKNLSTLEIHFIGLRNLKNMDSLIPKNEENPPKALLQFGKIWARDTTDDHPYCHLYHFSINQDRAGDGSSHGASTAKLILDETVGCPATGK
jgi:hypothetical protein